MPILFIDQLDIWLMILGATLIVTAYAIYVNIIRYGDLREISKSLGGGERLESSMKFELRPELVAINKGLGLYYIFVGVYALATGL